MSIFNNLKSPSGLSLVVAASCGLLLFGVLWLIENYFLSGVSQIPFNQMIWIVLGFSVLIFFLIRVLFEYFVYRQIKDIYRSIKSNKYPRHKQFSYNLEEIKKEVSTLDSFRVAEIEELRERERFRREFIGNISHELKTPIFNVQGYLLTLLDGAMNEPEVSEKYLTRANKSVERIISIIKDLDFITKLESGVLDLKPLKYDIYAQVKEIFEQLDELASERGVTLRFKKTYDPPIQVVADAKRIEQVLVNLMHNAIKYSKKSDGFVEVGFFEHANTVDIVISDNGLGIPEKDLPRIFERFYRVDKSRTRDAGGSGLGLAIVKHIIEAHKQTITAKSTEGVGSTFSFSLLRER